MRNSKQFVLAASVSAILGATTFAQAPYGNGNNSMLSDSTQGQSQVMPRRDSVSKDNSTATQRNRVTASDQKNDTADVNITKKIRQEIMAKKGMSISAQNVKIITINGKVTLKGEVNTANEKEMIGQIANKVASSKNVTNDLQVK